MNDDTTADLQWTTAMSSTIKRGRHRLHMSQAELGRRMGVTQTVAGRVENRPHRVRVERLRAALRVLGLQLVVSPLPGREGEQ